MLLKTHNGAKGKQELDELLKNQNEMQKGIF